MRRISGSAACTRDLPPKLIDDIEGLVRAVPGRGSLILEQLLTGNRIFQAAQRRHRGVVSLKQAWEWGFFRRDGARLGGRRGEPAEGAALRMLRRRWISTFPIGKNGDCYDPLLASAWKKMRQSVRIMKQCIAKLRAPDGQGPVAVEDNKIFRRAAVR